MRPNFRTLAAAAVAISLMAGCYDETDDDSNGPTGDVGGDSVALDAGDAEAGEVGDTVGPDAEVDGGGDADSGPTDADVRSETGSNGGDADAGPVCESDDMCPGNAVCIKKEGEDNECRRYMAVQIRDVTQRFSSSPQEACNDDASGADLFELELRGPFGKPLGYAQAIRAKSTAQVNTDAATVFDGTSNSLDQTPSGYCPSGGFGPDTILSLGCDGSLVTAFTDGAGNVLLLKSGQQLVVHEYGSQCCDSDCPEDFWEVRVCSAQSPREFQNASPDGDGHWPTCKTQSLGVGTDRGKVTIDLPRP